MRKLFALIFSFLLLTSVIGCAEDDLWDNFGDQNFYGQKAVSDQEFNNTLEKVKQRGFGKKRRDKNIPKGDEFHQSNETEFIKESQQELPVICVPVSLIASDSKVLPVGHYQVEGKMQDGQPVLKLYQAHYLIGEIPAVETDDDFDQDSVQFVRLLENGDNQVKIIFGSLDFNAYSIINIAE